MKKLTLASAVLLGLSGQTALAEDHGDWVGVYGMYYDVDEDRPGTNRFLDNGTGFGAEMGFRFAPQWAARIEATWLDVDTNGNADDQDGPLYGIDAMYFLDNDDAYLFTGFKILDLEDSFRMWNAGIGRHWKLNEDLKIITELAGYYDFGQEDRDYSVKIGLAYTFGASSSPSKPAVAAAAPADTDGDGVNDANDRCPGTPMGTKVDANGCAMPAMEEKPIMDTDGDGVTDDMDKCPTTPAGDVVDSDGCTRYTDKLVSENVRVLFANNSAEITNPGDRDIVEFAEFLKRYGKVEAEIEGHSSAPGAAAYNLELSQKRADAFKTLLIEEYGIAASRLTAVGYGETRLLDTSNTAEAHRINRRIAVSASETIQVKMTK